MQKWPESRLKRSLELLIKGIPIGMSNTLPGVSGGTLALVLGIYERVVNGIKEINFKVLIPVVLGAILGAIVGAQTITVVFTYYPNIMKAFLLGLIFASSGITFKKVKSYNWKTLTLGLLGLGIAYFYSVELSQGGPVAQQASIFKIFLGGTVGSMAMIIPGVSGGTILVMLGLYQRIMAAISHFDFSVLIPFGLGLGSGLLIFSWIISYLLDHYRSLLMAFLTGLILGSMRSVISAHIGEVVGFMVGFVAIYLLGKKS